MNKYQHAREAAEKILTEAHAEYPLDMDDKTIIMTAISRGEPVPEPLREYAIAWLRELALAMEKGGA